MAAAKPNPDWLDSLSEEWVSQPRGPDSSPGGIIASPAQRSATGSPLRHMRVLEGDGGGEGKAERPVGPKEDIMATMRIDKAILPSTTDWKRMIIEDMHGPSGIGGPGKDLFSPMGLENIFRPPPPPQQPGSPLRVISFNASSPTQRGSPTQSSPKPKHHFGSSPGSKLPLPKPLLLKASSRADPSPHSSPQLPPLLGESRNAESDRTQSPIPPRPLPSLPTSEQTNEESPVAGMCGDFNPAATSTLHDCEINKLTTPPKPQFSFQSNPTLEQLREDEIHVDFEEDLITFEDSDSSSGNVSKDYPGFKNSTEKSMSIPCRGNLRGCMPLSGGDIGSLASQVESNERISEIYLEKQHTVGGRTVGYIPVSKSSKYPPVPKFPDLESSVYPSSPPWLASQHRADMLPRIMSTPMLPSESDRNLASSQFDDSRYLPSPPQNEASEKEENSIPLEAGASSQSHNATEMKPRGVITSSPMEDPFAPALADKNRHADSLRTPSPQKKAGNYPTQPISHMENINRSPLKLFAGTYDTYTKQTLVRRISQFEGRSIHSLGSSPDHASSDVAETHIVDSHESRPFSDDLSLPATQLSGLPTSPPQTPPRDDKSLPISVTTTDPQSMSTGVRRQRHQRNNSSSSIAPNDGIHGPKSPVKERTPKRIRRTLSAGQLQQTASLVSDESEVECSTIQDEKGERNASQSLPRQRTYTSPQAPSPPPTSSPPSAPTQVSEGRSNHSPPIHQASPLPLNKNRVASLIDGADTLVSRKLPLLGTGRSIQSEEGKKGAASSTTQDFLAQAEEVMGRLRAIGSLSPQSANNSCVDNNSFLKRTTGTKEKCATSSTSNHPRNAKTGYASKSALANDSTTTTENFTGLTKTQGNSRPISETNPLSDDEGRSGLSAEGENRQENRTNGDTKTAGPSSLNSQHSSKSECVRVIHPDEVEHIIARDFGNMRFDSATKTWVKRKESDRRCEGGNDRGSAIGDDSEDPFQGISDLEVDEEMERLVLEPESAMKEMISELEDYVLEDSEHEDEGSHTQTQATARRILDSSPPYPNNNPPDPQAEKGSISTNPSHCSTSGEFKSATSAFSTVGRVTRETSWGNSYNYNQEEDKDEGTLDPESSQLSIIHPRDEDEPEFDDEDDYRPQQRGAGNRSVDYSSPSIRQSTRHQESSHILRSTPQPWSGGADSGNLSQPRVSSAFREYMTSSNSYRRMVSSGGKTFVGRPVSRINEEDEDVRSDDDQETNLEAEFGRLSISSALTPLPPRSVSGMRSGPPPASIKKRNVSFHLSSPLADLSYQFETTEALLNLELSYVATREQGKNRNVEFSFSLAQDDLVRHLTDVEPYEPYWDYMKYLKLNDRKIITLHGLHEWCPRIEELDVSNNDIGQLSGVPNTVRNLKIPGNSLSGLTAWGHLTNLQYLDVSRNDLDSLAGLKHLIHLREIKADDNRIESLDDIMHFDGLLSLRIRRNRIKQVDFEKGSLIRLEDLDLKGNGLERIAGLEKLTSLATLCLDNNSLTNIGLPVDGKTKLISLRTIKLCCNRLSTFDLSPFPHLRSVFLDDNALEHLSGLRKTKHLDSLSMREQFKHVVQEYGPSSSDKNPIPLGDMLELRKIYVSGNSLRLLQPHLSLDFLNLQYIELASAQITMLPENFGHLMSNIRVLNLNYNAITDIRPLFGIARLKKLLMVGNRIRSMRKLASVLGYFPNLSHLDLRLNPLTLGFYPPPVAVKTRTAEDNASLHPPTSPCPVFNNTASSSSSSSLSATYDHEPFTLPPLSEAQDRVFQSRLDLDTAAYRRRYEIVVGEKCKKMKFLDGLSYNKGEILARRDGVWEELRKMGLIKDREGEEGKEKEKERDKKGEQQKEKRRGKKEEPAMSTTTSTNSSRSVSPASMVEESSEKDYSGDDRN